MHFISLRKGKKKAINFANFEAISKVLGTKLVSKNLLLLLLRTIVVLLLIFSISGLTIVFSGESNDLGIIFSVDVSGSMLADDYKPNRLEAEKTIAKNILNNLKPPAKTGVVSFTGLGFLEQNLEEDIEKTKETITQLRVKRGVGTALGNAIVTSVNALTQTQKPKMIILMTDGQSNVGYPIKDAINFSREKNIVINTIGIGTETGGKIEGTESILKVNQTRLKEISNQTGGKYKKLSQPLSNMNLKGFIKGTKKKIPLDLSVELLISAIILLIIDLGLQSTKFKILPS